MSRLSDLNEDILREIFQWHVQLQGSRNISRWIRILHISRAWRTAALNQPSLWTSIDVRRGPSQVAFMLAHSRGLPLSIVISHASSPAAFPLIEPHTHRLHSLDVHGLIDNSILSWVLTPKRFPHLSVFTLDVEGSPCVEGLFAVLPHMPVLEELSVRMEGSLMPEDIAQADKPQARPADFERLARLTLCATDALFVALWRALSVPAHTRCELTVISPLRSRSYPGGFLCRLLRPHIMRVNTFSPLHAADIVVEYRADVLSRLGYIKDTRSMFETRLSSSGTRPPWCVFRCVYADGWEALPVSEMLGLHETLSGLQLRTVALQHYKTLSAGKWESIIGKQPAVRRVSASVELCGDLIAALDPTNIGLFPALDTLVVLGGASGVSMRDNYLRNVVFSTVLGRRPLRRLVLQDFGEAAEDVAACLRADACADSVEVRQSAAHGAVNEGE